MGWVEVMERNWKLKNELQGYFRIIEIYETRIKTRLSFLYTVQTQEVKGSGWRCGFILTSGQKQTKSWREGGKLKIRKFKKCYVVLVIHKICFLNPHGFKNINYSYKEFEDGYLNAFQINPYILMYLHFNENECL